MIFNFFKSSDTLLREKAKKDLDETRLDIYKVQLSLESSRGWLATLHERESRLSRFLKESEQNEEESLGK